MKVRETTPAPRDPAGILDGLHQHSREGAASVARAHGHARDQLSRMPYCGRKLDEFEAWRLPLVTHPYMIFYRVRADVGELQILRIVHSARVKNLGRVREDE
jgi:plasmid stabilization system protein ParE